MVVHPTAPSPVALAWTRVRPVGAGDVLLQSSTWSLSPSSSALLPLEPDRPHRLQGRTTRRTPPPGTRKVPPPGSEVVTQPTWPSFRDLPLIRREPVLGSTTGPRRTSRTSPTSTLRRGALPGQGSPSVRSVSLTTLWYTRTTLMKSLLPSSTAAPPTAGAAVPSPSRHPVENLEKTVSTFSCASSHLFCLKKAPASAAVTESPAPLEMT
mmetsp:Transcript_76344/g.206277  ORF Transcript_76344/g.206277 Transcript_76344/m.206277 type:complete len:210 (+) Transcript_76344:109-738(+)